VNGHEEVLKLLSSYLIKWLSAGEKLD